MHVFCKNARLNNPDGLAELDAEVSALQWDLILFNETRAISQDLLFDVGHRLLSSLDDNIAASVGIFVHARHVSNVRKVYRISDRILRLDLELLGHEYITITLNI